MERVWTNTEQASDRAGEGNVYCQPWDRLQIPQAIFQKTLECYEKEFENMPGKQVHGVEYPCPWPLAMFQKLLSIKKGI